MTRLLLWLERRHYRACAKARDKYRPPFTSPAVTTRRKP
jgi:hypothetical protein